MLQRIRASVQTKAWQKSLAEAVRQPRELLAQLALSDDPISLLTDHQPDFPLRVPQSYIRRMAVGEPNDPLLRQVLSTAAERAHVEGFGTSPVGDDAATLQSGLLQKYQGRVLVLATAACPIHCRYCFRRHFPYGDHSGQHRDWHPVLNAIAADTTLSEVILSGGDPLSLADEYLAELVEGLGKIAHLKRLRIHSRFPVVLPERIDRSLLGWIGKTRLNTTVVIHCNHGNEINGEVRDGLAQLKSRNVTLLNQTVLLKGVNDSAETLTELSETLFEAGVLPYYLHMLDRVSGAAHFDTSEQSALLLMESLRRRLPGYLVPRLVKEIAGEPYKRPLA
ncbi:MAG TPA: EF-P beta-lysylation protein EpmB [Candidatus Tenderia sp.]|nr:EF-P beta-lysylation protein EpmB [Candidatus Tenderia sp.]